MSGKAAGGKGRTKDGRAYGRHPAEVTSDRLHDAYMRWGDRFSEAELDALASAAAALARLAGEDSGPRQLRPCGTDAAYQRHLRNDEEPCDECRRAHTAAFREWRAS